MNFLIKYKRIFYILGIIIAFLTLTILGNMIAYQFISQSDTSVSEDTSSSPSSNCNVLGIKLQGTITTYIPNSSDGSSTDDTVSSEDIVSAIETAKNNPDIKAVILSIDSSGGSGVAGEEVANALKGLGKPSVAIIRDSGSSAAYWAATGADKIYASNISSVGSIGVTQSYLDETAKDAKDGYKYIELTSVPYKDLGSPSRPITEEEKVIVIADLVKDHKVFVSEVAQNRNLKVEDVAKLANGLSYEGMDALKYGLIDGIGDMTTATKYIEDQIGEKADICWY